MVPNQSRLTGHLLHDVLNEARETIEAAEVDLPNPSDEIAEDVHYTMALVAASMPTAQEAAEAFLSFGISAKAP